jgi:hypothetical protein
LVLVVLAGKAVLRLLAEPLPGKAGAAELHLLAPHFMLVVEVVERQEPWGVQAVVEPLWVLQSTKVGLAPMRLVAPFQALGKMEVSGLPLAI